MAWYVEDGPNTPEEIADILTDLACNGLTRPEGLTAQPAPIDKRTTQGRKAGPGG